MTEILFDKASTDLDVVVIGSAGVDGAGGWGGC